MDKRHNKLYYIFILILAMVLSIPSNTAISASLQNYDEDSVDTNILRYYLGTVVNTGKDNGYSEAEPIGEKDPHYGWNLGKFFVEGYTRVSNDVDGNLVFLKNVGDVVTLWFNLEQDIDSLNGSDNLTINEDENGYDNHFGIEKTNFGRGTLIIRYTNYENLTDDPVIYTDYLEANVQKGVDTKVELFEEGDYEVSLNYEIKDSPRKIFGRDIIPSYTNYKIYFQFSVRNGNSMVFPFDVRTKAELSNNAITKNGFYLDLAKSRYLDIDIKREVLKNGVDGLVEDVRFNRPAKDGDSYREEGIYTISVRNRYTGQETTKKIYVGENDVLKAHITTGLSVGYIEDQISQGATIADDGTIIQPVEEINAEVIESEPEATPIEGSTENSGLLAMISNRKEYLIGAALVLILIVLVILIKQRIANKTEDKYGGGKNGVDAGNGREDNDK
jgi:hypothetical protein